jgi:hypothetical protein
MFSHESNRRLYLGLDMYTRVEVYVALFVSFQKDSRLSFCGKQGVPSSGYCSCPVADDAIPVGFR